MQLGAFSVSLAVKDLAASRAFYEKFGFTTMGGDAAQGWLILRNGDHILGQRRLKAAGVTLTAEADESGSGPAHFMAVDPDGNPILVDQHR